MKNAPEPQQDRATALLKRRGMVRLSEFVEEGITAATVSRMKSKGLIVQLGRGLYQLPDAPLDANHSLAEAAKLVPKGIICLSSALAFHELTDTIPRMIWMAIGFREWEPHITQPPIQIVKFGPKMLAPGARTHLIEGVPVKIYEPAKTIVDLFYYALRPAREHEAKISVTLALQGMKEALRLRKATPGAIARFATDAGIWKKVQPYLEAMTVDA